MKNIKLIIEYDGTNYAGWQKQKNAVTIQQTLEEAVLQLTGETVNLVGSSRTDAGVHAKGFVANFKTQSSIPGKSFREALNTMLPEDITVLESEEVPLDFHSRYSSKSKMYSYTIINRIQPPAIGRNYVYHFKKELNFEEMQKACNYFIGKHDFSAFKSTGSSVKTSVRTIKKAFINRDNNKIIIYVEADGFLYNMVRIMVGTLIDVGIGKIRASDIKDIIQSKDRSRAGKTVPASGLCLEFVHYN
ncbi:tRNA pseudouridine(38-40) synthase TruA [Clostridium sp. SYSU_GA19001]|uniref:tRNA pseudouridine(38-40) synthase TruA n=1 Tax=Clostridium caldaquaticum TaxID=2940653 RepID=UPI0020773B40|nr:tRNA pseudouridine(38-40) synthase TruA [Clostridium caldaquaticum]MCM8710764.1 tRNA pseudouridine(38-40) synthase TruA [Clostridium caldaquaticum]